MNKSLVLLLLPISLLVSSCGGAIIPSNTNDSKDSGNPGSSTSESGPSTSEGGTTDTSTSEGGDPINSDSIQNYNILHAWDWSISNVISRLDDIKNAGYGSIQLSPLQPQKDYYTGQTWKSQWWKLYQPYGFSIAQSNQNVLGTKSELANLCSKANEKGLKIIVDVVSNHLAGGNGTSLNSKVGDYEPVIKNNNLIHTLGKSADDNNLQSIVQGTIGDFPDLKTEDTRVQERVISLLKEYIDCGVSGFRFDAAKHIETPNDGDYASSYWPNILNAATSYATSKGKDTPYYYGEILTTCGVNRSYSSYTEYMSVIDNKQGEKILSGVTGDNISKLDDKYNSKVSADKLVLWAESHDTYANDNKQTTNIAVEDINKAYMIQASRKDASSLFFVRPDGYSTIFGEVGTNYWKNSEIKAINLFHNRYINKAEAINNNNGCFVNVRGSGSNAGAAIINIANTSTTVTVNVNGLANGTYTDLVSNTKFNVSNGQVSAKFTNNACILVPDNGGDQSVPQLNPTVPNEVYSGSTVITVNASNAKTVTYSINNTQAKALNTTTLTLGESLSNGLISIKFTATNDYGSVSKTLNLIKTNALINKDLIIYNLDTNYQYKLWTWKGSNNGTWKDLTMEGNVGGYSMGEDDTFIVVKWNKNETNPDWGNKVNQTENISKTQRIYNYNDLTIK